MNTANMPASRDEVNLAAAMEFVRDFLDGTEGPMWVCSLLNPPGGTTNADAGPDDDGRYEKRKQRHVLTRNPDRIEAFIKRRDEPGYGLYFALSSMTPGERRKKEFADEMPFVTADIDFKHIDLAPEEILRRLLALPHPPGRIHASAHGYHVFWRLLFAAGPKQHALPRDNQGETAASIRMRMRRGGADGARA